MKIGARVGTVIAAAGLLLLSGCGLDIMVMTDPMSAVQGEDVDFTVMVKNRTECQVTEGLLFVATFIPPGELPPSFNFCDVLNDVDPDDFPEIERTLGRAFSPAMVGHMMQTAHDHAFGISPDGGGQAVNTCATSFPAQGGATGFDPSFFEVQCEFDSLDAFAKETFNFTLQAPFDGPIRTVALAFGEIPNDPACRPGLPEEGIVVGCFDSANASRPAPAMSLAGLAAATVALFALGTFRIIRRRRPPPSV